MKKLTVTLFALMFCAPAFARDQIKVVGSSTAYPFSSYVAEEFGSISRYPIPVIESTGTGGGMKLFCSGNELSTPDIVNASRRIMIKEYKFCQRNGVKAITEIMFGYDGIVVAQSSRNEQMNLTKRELLLAVAKLVPNESATKLIENPYTHWNQINPALPERKITIYGPPVSSGTRDAFEEIVMEYETDEIKVYRDTGNKGYRIIRTDGVYIPSGENDNLIVKKLDKDEGALGIFGYSFLAENQDTISAINIDGIEPTVENIATKDYPISRSLYFYLKSNRLSQVEGIEEFATMFLDEEIVGEDGLLIEMGLIPLQPEVLAASKKNLESRHRLTLNDLKEK